MVKPCASIRSAKSMVAPVRYGELIRSTTTSTPWKSLTMSPSRDLVKPAGGLGQSQLGRAEVFHERLQFAHAGVRGLPMSGFHPAGNDHAGHAAVPGAARDTGRHLAA